MRRCATALLALVFSAALLAPAAAAQSPTAAAPSVIDGPNQAIVGFGTNSLAIARDGTGGLAYVKNVGGSGHIFVSRLVNGSFAPGIEVDGSLSGVSGTSAQPVVAAGNGGVLLVAFVNGGVLYVVDFPSASSGPLTPQALASNASNPAISMSNFGKAYLAFTVAGQGGGDVRCAFYDGGQWTVEPTPMDANPADDAGTGTGAPAVTAAGDGIGIVAWGEAGHVYTRRIWGASPSIAFQQADVPSLGGWSEASADEPAIDSGGDSSYAAVAFRETFAANGQTQTRVLMQRLQAGIYDGIQQPDGLTTPGPEGAEQPRVSVGEYGQGFLTSARTTTYDLLGMQLGQNETPQGVQRIDTLQNTSLPDAVPTSAGYHDALIAWQQSPGQVGLPDLRARFYDGTTLQPEQVLSSPTQGALDAGAGLADAGDIAADIAVAWVQATASGNEIVTAQLYQPPGGFSPAPSFAYARTATPTLAWSAARESWGPLTYTVTLDGEQVGQTSATSLQVPTAQYPQPLTQGRHTFRVTATNAVGLSSSSGQGTVFVDTVAPVVKVAVSGRHRAGSTIHVDVRANDAPAPLTRAQASGVASIVIRFGHGAAVKAKHHRASHVWNRPGHYRVTVIVTDRAGNTTKIVKTIHITKAKGHRARH